MKKIVTKEMMINVIETKDIPFIKKYVGRALVAIYNNQTDFEKRNNITKDSNGLGFTGTDAKSGSLLARYYMRHGNLENWMLAKWVREERGSPRITKYWKQLNVIANSRNNNEPDIITLFKKYPTCKKVTEGIYTIYTCLYTNREIIFDEYTRTIVPDDSNQLPHNLFKVTSINVDLYLKFYLFSKLKDSKICNNFRISNKFSLNTIFTNIKDGRNFNIHFDSRNFYIESDGSDIEFDNNNYKEIKKYLVNLGWQL